MNPYITAANIDDYAFINSDALRGDIKGISVCFHGLGDGVIYEKSDARNAYLGENGVLSIFPYYDLWGWMNETTVRFTDELVDVAIGKFGLAEDVPLVYSGGSMGGLGALIYSKMAKRAPVACCADSPVCDIYHGFEGFAVSFKRSLLSAYYGMPGDFAELRRARSPMCVYRELPRVPYYVVCGGADDNVRPEAHGEPLCRAMRAAGFDVQYERVEEMRHCGLDSFPEARKRYLDFEIRNIEARARQ